MKKIINTIKRFVLKKMLRAGELRRIRLIAKTDLIHKIIMYEIANGRKDGLYTVRIHKLDIKRERIQVKITRSFNFTFKLRNELRRAM